MPQAGILSWGAGWLAAPEVIAALDKAITALSRQYGLVQVLPDRVYSDPLFQILSECISFNEIRRLKMKENLGFLIYAESRFMHTARA